jgi:hypothetical protein
VQPLKAEQMCKDIDLCIERKLYEKHLTVELKLKTKKKSFFNQNFVFCIFIFYLKRQNFSSNVKESQLMLRTIRKLYLDLVSLLRQTKLWII